MYAVFPNCTVLSPSLISLQSVAVLVFFIPYVVFQPFMTVIARKLGPTLFLGTIIICWAAIEIV